MIALFSKKIFRSEQTVLIRTVSNVHFHKRCFEELSGEQVVSNLCKIINKRLVISHLQTFPFNKAFQINDKTPQTVVLVTVVDVRRYE